MIKTDWSIVACDYDTATGGITNIHWRCSATEDGVKAGAYGSTHLDVDAKAPGFIAFANVTEARVMAWLHSRVDKAETEAGLAKSIAAKQNPAKAIGIPWPVVLEE
jgi:hypothetical protein